MMVPDRYQAGTKSLGSTRRHGITRRQLSRATSTSGNFAKATELRQRIWFTIGALIVFPVPQALFRCRVSTPLILRRAV